MPGRLTDAALKAIEFDLSLGPQFVEMCKQSYIDENARFLLAVLRFKKDPTWDRCQTVFSAFLENEYDCVNVSNPLRSKVVAYVERCRKNLATDESVLPVTRSHSRPLPAVPTVFDACYDEILNMLSENLDRGAYPKQKASADEFYAKVNKLKPGLVKGLQ